MKQIKFLFIIVLVILILFGCNKTNKFNKKYNYRPNNKIIQRDNAFARIVEGFTSKVYPSEPIKIRFVDDMVDKEKVGKEETSGFFSISPHTKGYLSWETAKTLVFKPEYPFKIKERYTIKLNFVKLGNPKYSDKDIFTADVYIKHNNIQNIDGDFVQDDSTHIHYFGKIKFEHSIRKSDLEKNLTFYREGKPLPLHITGSDVGKSFEFKTDSFFHNDKLTKFKIEMSKTDFFLLKDLRIDFVLSVLSEMKVQKVSLQKDLTHPTVKVLFSSELNSKQDINGLIYTKPPLELKLKKMGKSVLVSGNFELGKEYELIIDKNIKNKFSKKLDENYTRKIKFSDFNPDIVFGSDGVFLPEGNNKKITFKTMNIKKVRLDIKKIFTSNMTQFFQDSELYSDKKNRRYVNFYRVGISLKSQYLDIGNRKNHWLQSELDLSKLLPKGEKGLYVLTLCFQGDWTLVKNQRGGRCISKMIILSDMGLTCFKDKNKSIVYAIDVNTAKPISGAVIKAISYQNQVIETHRTDSKGKVEFTKKWLYLLGEYKDKRSYLTKKQMKWNLSTFDVDGVSAGTQTNNVFIYTDRGVYRPGDKIHLSMIFRNENQTFPDNMPIKLKLLDPRNREIFSKVIKNGKDGFYVYSFKTDEDAPTGNWTMMIDAGNIKKNKSIKIETIVPERLKINIIPELPQMGRQDKINNITLKAKYLFGAPAKGLNASLKIKYISLKKRFKKYKDFTFDDETKIFHSFSNTLFEGKLNNKGAKNIKLELPAFGDISSQIIAKLDAEVIEKGGRADKQWTSFTYTPYNAFVGLKKDFSYIRMGKNHKFEIILLNKNGEPVIGNKLKVTVYKNNTHWWWEYRRDENNKMNFKTDSATEIVFQKKITSQEHPVRIDFTPTNDVRYLIEVKHDIPNGHSASVFLNPTWYWRDYANGGMQNAGLLTLTTDKKSYFINEKAVVKFPAPKGSTVLVSLDKGDKNIFTKTLITGKSDTTVVKIPLTDQMTPNVYCSVSVIQSQKNSDNDRPIRMFGIVPIMVQNDETVEKITLDMPDTLRPNQKFKCKIRTKGKTQFTIAIVNEGLLSLTHFKTPNPWKAFYKKIRYAISVYDNLNLFLGTNKGDIFKTFSVGGDMYDAIMEKKKSPTEKKRRFKPVVLFKGPIQTDDNGYAEVNFTMPDYIGEVRVMIVSASHDRYGSLEKSVPVKSELMILPTLPRVIAPGDIFYIPVTIFSMDKKIKDVKVTLKTEGAISCNDNIKQVSFTKPDSKDIYFKIKVKDKLGFAKIKISAVSGKYKAYKDTDINIRAPFARIFKDYEKRCIIDSTIYFDIPDIGLQGANQLKLTISKQQTVNYEKRLKYLIRYPYGCLEQTVSSVFPQLYLSNYIKQTDPMSYKIDDNINTAIQRLRKFTTYYGTFRYWPYYYSSVHPWANLYAGYFLLEAKKAGYYVPKPLLDNWIYAAYQDAISSTVHKKKSLKDNRYDTYSDIFRMYLLALAKKPVISKMNLMKENNLSYLDNPERWLLAAAYKLAGMDDVANEIAEKSGITTLSYYDYYYEFTFGSHLRNKAIILNSMLILNKDNKDVKSLYDYLVKEMNSKKWYSTQTTAYTLMAIGNYIKHFPDEFNKQGKISAKIYLPNGNMIKFNSDKQSKTIELPEFSQGKIKIKLDRKSDVNRAYVLFNWSGIPKKAISKKVSEKLDITKRFYDENNNVIEVSQIVQGKVFIMEIVVKNETMEVIKNIALTQILPSGWEVENDRLNNNGKHRNDVYTDIRDDRVMNFFNLSQYSKKTFKIKLRAVSAGTFYMPATKAEAMYNHKYIAYDPGFEVKVTKQ